MRLERKYQLNNNYHFSEVLFSCANKFIQLDLDRRHYSVYVHSAIIEHLCYRYRYRVVYESYFVSISLILLASIA